MTTFFTGVKLPADLPAAPVLQVPRQVRGWEVAARAVHKYKMVKPISIFKILDHRKLTVQLYNEYCTLLPAENMYSHVCSGGWLKELRPFPNNNQQNFDRTTLIVQSLN